MLVLNLSRTGTQTLDIPESANRYTLTATDLMGKSVLLNGTDLSLTAGGDIPKLAGVETKRGSLTLPAASITFLTFDGAKNPACR